MSQDLLLENPPSKIVLVVNKTSFFLSHRKNIAQEALRRKIPFLLLSPEINEEEQETLKALGVEWRAIPFNRLGHPLSSFFKTFFFTHKLARELSQDGSPVFHLVTFLPIIFCGIALRLGSYKCVFALSGMGSMFSSTKWRHRLGRVFVSYVYRFLMSGRKSRVIVQNQDDFRLLTDFIKVSPDKIHLVRGSGLKLEDFPFSPKTELSEIPIFLLPGRLIREKGIFEAARVSRQLDEQGLAHELWIAGSQDFGNPLCIQDQELRKLEAECPHIRFLGHRSDLPELYKKADFILFPSYREGLPKALLEAGSVGRPVVAFDVPGVRELIVQGRTGLLAKFADTQELTDLCRRLMSDASLRDSLVHGARKDLEEHFSDIRIVAQIFEIYESFGRKQGTLGKKEGPSYCHTSRLRSR